MKQVSRIFIGILIISLLLSGCLQLLGKSSDQKYHQDTSI